MQPYEPLLVFNIFLKIIKKVKMYFEKLKESINNKVKILINRKS